MFRQWEYDRLSRHHWERLLYAVAETGSTAPLLKKHPLLPGTNDSFADYLAIIFAFLSVFKSS